jgi:hypothetical protein
LPAAAAQGSATNRHNGLVAAVQIAVLTQAEADAAAPALARLDLA